MIYLLAFAATAAFVGKIAYDEGNIEWCVGTMMASAITMLIIIIKIIA